MSIRKENILMFSENGHTIYVIFPVIEEANWLTLTDDVEGSESFDAVVCLGNSFAHLPDMSGDQSEHK